MNLKLESIKQIKGKILLKSGLHIGAGDTQMHIGGTDAPVIKHPHTLEPYIPGSSLKGKVRALLELKEGYVGKTDGKPYSTRVLSGLDDRSRTHCENLLKLFGTSGDDDGSELGPTRVSFADATLSEESRSDLTNNRWPMTEVKAENTINRIKGTAEHPRFIERVVPGLKFDFSISLKHFEGDEGIEELLREGLSLLEKDSLGGSGSRGYGRIEFEFSNQA